MNKIIILLFVLSCASSSELKYKDLTTRAVPNERQAAIYFIKSQGMLNSKVFILNHARRIGLLKNGSYFYKYLNPGLHRFNFADEFIVDPTVLNLELQAGQEYYLLLQEYEVSTFASSVAVDKKYGLRLKKIPKAEAEISLQGLSEIDLESNSHIWQNQD
jgi:hypothetical protein